MNKAYLSNELLNFVLPLSDGGTTVKVIAGDCLGVNACIETRTPILVLDIRISPGNEFEVDIPNDFNAFVYVWRGAGFLGVEGKAAKMGDVSRLTHSSFQNFCTLFVF